MSLPLFASARHFLQLSLKTETRPRLVQGPWCNTPPALKHTVSSSGCGLLPIKATTSPLLKVWRRTRIAPASNPRSEPSRVRSPRVKNTPSQLLNNTRALNNGLYWDGTQPGTLRDSEPLFDVCYWKLSLFTELFNLFLSQSLKFREKNRSYFFKEWNSLTDWTSTVS